MRLNPGLMSYDINSLGASSVAEIPMFSPAHNITYYSNAVENIERHIYRKTAIRQFYAREIIASLRAIRAHD